MSVTTTYTCDRCGNTCEAQGRANVRPEGWVTLRVYRLRQDYTATLLCVPCKEDLYQFINPDQPLRIVTAQ